MLNNILGFTREYHQTVTALTHAEQILWIIGGGLAGSMNESKQKAGFRTTIDVTIPLLLLAKQYLVGRNMSITRIADPIIPAQSPKTCAVETNFSRMTPTKPTMLIWKPQKKRFRKKTLI